MQKSREYFPNLKGFIGFIVCDQDAIVEAKLECPLTRDNYDHVQGRSSLETQSWLLRQVCYSTASCVQAYIYPELT